jgi:hypothetical protein
MPQMGFETTIPLFERDNTFHALDRAATVIGWYIYNVVNHRKEEINMLSTQARKTDNLTAICEPTV